MATIQINGTTLIPQPRTIEWISSDVGGKLDGTTATGAYDVLVLKSPPSNGGTANFNWGDYENSTLTSVRVMAKGDSQKTGANVTYSSGAVSRPIKIISKPGDIIETQMEILVIT